MADHVRVKLDPNLHPTLSVEEYAEIVGVARSTGFASVKAGEVPSFRVGKRIRIPTAAVRRMLEIDGPDAAA